MPELDDLLQLFESTKALYSDLRTEMEKDERYVTGDYGDTFLPDDWDDEGLEAIITSTAKLMLMKVLREYRSFYATPREPISPAARSST